MIGAIRAVLRNPRARSLVRGARDGASIGVATGLVAATADAVYAALSRFSGGLGALVFSIFGLVVPVFAALGGLLGAYLAPFSERARRQERFLARIGTSLGASLPAAAFWLWVPSGWILEHWGTLKPFHRALALGALATTFITVVFVVWLGHAIVRRWATGGIRRLWAWIACLALALAAGAAYWADAVVFEGDYEDFHYGLCVGFATLVALLVMILLALKKPVPSDLLPRWRRLAIEAVPALLCLAFVGVAVAPKTAFGRSNALVFGKLLGTGRFVIDVDRDGYSSLLGGGDCAAFDPRFSPGKLEIPENGIDDDCTGRDAEWPTPRPEPAATAPRLWNVLLVSIDALRADHVGAYGYERRTTPNIDRLAKKSLVFLEAYSQAPKTNDSVPSFHTGAYPSNLHRDATQARRRFRHSYNVTADARPLAAMLRAKGYKTAAGVGFRLFQIDEGFESFTTGNPTDTARRFLATTATPFFLWLHYAEPHEPYEKHRNHNFGSTLIDRYDGEIALADEKFGKVLDTLDERALTDSTVVIVTADHGEEFGDHGGFSHTRKLYRELLHVPLIVKVPGMKPRRVEDPVELVDIVPTLSELIGLESLKGRQDGQSLLIEKRARKNRGAYAEDLREPYGTVLKRALFDGRYRLIDDRQNDRLELYDSRKDRREQKDIGFDRPDVVEKLREALGVWPLRRHTETFRTLTPKTDARTWALLLPTVRRTEMLELALERFPRDRSPERDAVLEQLLERSNLSPEVTEKARSLLGGE
jgi:arylsulfatase A-like enzyme